MVTFIFPVAIWNFATMTIDAQNLNVGSNFKFS